MRSKTLATLLMGLCISFGMPGRVQAQKPDFAELLDQLPGPTKEAYRGFFGPQRFTVTEPIRVGDCRLGNIVIDGGALCFEEVGGKDKWLVVAGVPDLTKLQEASDLQSWLTALQLPNGAPGVFATGRPTAEQISMILPNGEPGKVQVKRAYLSGNRILFLDVDAYSRMKEGTPSELSRFRVLFESRDRENLMVFQAQPAP